MKLCELTASLLSEGCCDVEVQPALQPLPLWYATANSENGAGLKKPGFHTHNIKLTILPEINCWLSIEYYHTPLCALLQIHKSGFGGSFSQTLCKPWVVLWRH